MKYLKKKLGDNGACAKDYIQERSNEIDSERKFPTIVICPGGAFIMTSFWEDETIALRFLDAGFNVVIVHYATDGSEKYLEKSSDDFPKKPVSLFPNSLVELAMAVSYLRENSKRFAVNKKYIIRETRKRDTILRIISAPTQWNLKRTISRWETVMEESFFFVNMRPILRTVW